MLLQRRHREPCVNAQRYTAAFKAYARFIATSTWGFMRRKVRALEVRVKVHVLRYTREGRRVKVLA
jgi:hypothetical protein